MTKYRIESEDVQRLIDEAKGETREPAKEVLERLFEGLLQVSSFRLKDGLQANVMPYFEPRVDDDGQYHCGIDVNFSDGSQLEFTVTNTGWGRPLGPIADMIANHSASRCRAERASS